MKEFLVKAELENLDRVLEFISESIEHCPIKTQNQINIAVDEIFSNIARYAYHPETGDLIVRIEMIGDAGEGHEGFIFPAIKIEFEDKGTAYNPLIEKDPDIEKPTEEREVGGLGIFLVKKLMDSVEYKRIDDKNVLIIRKRIDLSSK